MSQHVKLINGTRISSLIFFVLLGFSTSDIRAEEGTGNGIPYQGTYNLIVWHPMGTQETTIQVGPGQTHDMNILITPTSPTIYSEEEPVNNPFGIDLVGDSSIVPTVELQKWEPGSESGAGDAS